MREIAKETVAWILISMNTKETENDQRSGLGDGDMV